LSNEEWTGEYLERLIQQRDSNIENGLPYTVNTGIDQAIGILNRMLEERKGLDE
jgi:hypothetical protein